MFFGNIFWDYFLNKKVKYEDDNEKEVSMGSPQQIITEQAVLQKELQMRRYCTASPLIARKKKQERWQLKRLQMKKN